MPLLRDAYGLRFGVLAQMTGRAHSRAPTCSTSILCHGFYQVLGSGYYPDKRTATAAWQGFVGASAANAEPAPDDPLPHVLPGGLIDGLFGQPLSDMVPGLPGVRFRLLDEEPRLWRVEGD